MGTGKRKKSRQTKYRVKKRCEILATTKKRIESARLKSACEKIEGENSIDEEMFYHLPLFSEEHEGLAEFDFEFITLLLQWMVLVS